MSDTWCTTYPFATPEVFDITDLHCDVTRIINDMMRDGQPIVLRGFDKLHTWNKELLSIRFLTDTHGHDNATCHDLRSHQDVEMPLRTFVKKACYTSLTEQRKNKDLLYAKDLAVPHQWRTVIMEKIIPPPLRWMGENDFNSFGSGNAAENLLLYIGPHNTWTPMHKDHCGTVAHNLMLDTAQDAHSIWFMVSVDNSKALEELWHTFNEDLELESFPASIEHLARATFPILVYKQQKGDLMVLPPNVYHQVINKGPATMKVAWSRLTMESLKLSITSILPRYREIFFKEAFNIKVIIKCSLEGFISILRNDPACPSFSKELVRKHFQDLLSLYRDIVLDEWVDIDGIHNDPRLRFSPQAMVFTSPTQVTKSSPISCDYCNTNIFNRHVHCNICSSSNESYDICTWCFAFGRGCKHRLTSVQFTESYTMRTLRQLYSDAADVWNIYSTQADTIPKDIIQLGRDLPFSSATLAYTRWHVFHNLPITPVSCHRCKQVKRNQLVFSCTNTHNNGQKWRQSNHRISCKLTFCEYCLFERFNLSWTDIFRNSGGPFICPRCSKSCDCSQCGNETVCHPKGPVNKLLYNDPSENPKNRGGVQDSISRASVSQGSKKRPRPQNTDIESDDEVNGMSPAFARELLSQTLQKCTDDEERTMQHLQELVSIINRRVHMTTGHPSMVSKQQRTR
ncbi:MAG: hypothetical protein J3Q66DRAFT_361598 [Benniella sp.]|nr:MAG: hypothetical protein J3Q66DRAFT_361598 [Benniella sp.]